jgi:hypothetical protein
MMRGSYKQVFYIIFLPGTASFGTPATAALLAVFCAEVLYIT